MIHKIQVGNTLDHLFNDEDFSRFHFYIEIRAGKFWLGGIHLHTVTTVRAYNVKPTGLELNELNKALNSYLKRFIARNSGGILKGETIKNKICVGNALDHLFNDDAFSCFHAVGNVSNSEFWLNNVYIDTDAKTDIYNVKPTGLELNELNKALNSYLKRFIARNYRGS